tara:strand:- start:73 stop:633 length:561 start_codon:yes stop_codon:yes gene_type:complete
MWPTGLPLGLLTILQRLVLDFWTTYVANGNTPTLLYNPPGDGNCGYSCILRGLDHLKLADKFPNNVMDFRAYVREIMYMPDVRERFEHSFEPDVMVGGEGRVLTGSVDDWLCHVTRDYAYIEHHIFVMISEILGFVFVILENGRQPNVIKPESWKDGDKVLVFILYRYGLHFSLVTALAHVVGVLT